MKARLPRTNTIIIAGRLTRECEFKTTASNVSILMFSIAVSESYKKGNEWIDESSFFDCKAFGDLANRMVDKLGKGVPVIVEGKIKQNRWQDHATGTNRSKVGIIARNIQLLEYDDSQNNQSGQTNQNDTETDNNDVPF